VPHLSTRSRLPVALLLGIAAAAQLSAADGVRDAEFDKVPFAQWLAGGEQTQLKWSERALPVVLSVHQRLMARLVIQLDGAEAANRRGEGQMIFYFQLTDSMGRIYQDHTSYDLTKVEEGLKAQDLSVTEYAFVLPGDYAVSLAIYDTATKEHSIKKTRLHISPMKADPLPSAWRNLPPVEFVEPTEPPDHWFLPKEAGKLNLPLTPQHPVRIDVLVNLTPTEQSSRTYGVQDRNLSFLLPALKVLSQITAPGRVLNVGLFDLSRRRATFHQEDVRDLDWPKMKASLSEANAGSIDVKSLADRQHNAAFFLSEVERRFASGESSPGVSRQAHAVVVLSGPMFFDAGQELPEQPVKPPDCRLFYIRIQNPTVTVPLTDAGANRRRGLGGFPGRGRTPAGGGFPLPADMDQLLPLLKPLDPHSFDVMTAEQFRKALATIMSEISSL